MMNLLKTAILAFSLTVVQYANAQELDELSAPTGDVVLTVKGDLPVSNTPEGWATFDLEMLEQMDAVTFTTETIWTVEPQEFTGVSLKTFFESLGIEEGDVMMRAMDDYNIDFPVSDGVEDGPILAYLNAGEPMSVRDKGPIWLVYPFDQKPEYQSEIYYTRSIWQLIEIEVLE